VPLPVPEEGDKKARGTVLVIGGSAQVPGGALLAGLGALRAGAGRLQIATCARNATALAIAIPEALVIGLPETVSGDIQPTAMTQLLPFLEGADSVLLGPGLSQEDSAAGLAAALLAVVPLGPGLIFDAAAITKLLTMPDLLGRHHGRIVITLHAGEMAGLMALRRHDVESDPVRIAVRAARELGAVVAVKGAQTVVASYAGEQRICREGNVGLATSGSGDVLAGIVAGLMARGTSAFTATCWAVYLHAAAGDRLAKEVGPLGFLAREILPEIPALMDELSKGLRVIGRAN